MKNYIFYLRPFAAFAVVCCHVTALFDGNGFSFVNIVNKFSFWAVPIFIMISGAIILDAEILPVRSFYQKKLKRLIPAFLIWNMFYFFSYQVSSNQYTVLGRLHLFSMKLFAASHLWYLPVFFTIMLLSPLVKYFIEGKKQSQKFLFFIGTLFLADMLIRQIKETYFNFEWPTIFSVYLGFFFIGYILDKYIKASIKRVIFISISLISLLAFGFLIELKHEIYFFNYISLSNTLIAIFIFLIFVSCMDRPPNKMIRSLSDTSFGIYLIHLFFVSVFSKMGYISQTNFLVYCFIIYILSFLSIFLLRKCNFGRLIT